MARLQHADSAELYHDLSSAKSTKAVFQQQLPGSHKAASRADQGGEMKQQKLSIFALEQAKMRAVLAALVS